jgi:dual specificity phosphatase 3
VDLRTEWNDREVWDHFPQVTYVHAPTTDAIGHTIPKEVFDVVVATARNLTAATGKMLVHCHMGINRGPSGAMAVLLDRGIDPVQAFDMVRTARPEAAIYYAMDALCADQKRRGTHDTPQGLSDRTRLGDHVESIWTEKEQARISHIIREKHDFDLRELFA